MILISAPLELVEAIIQKELSLNRCGSLIIDRKIKLTMSPNSLPPSVDTSMLIVLGHRSKGRCYMVHPEEWIRKLGISSIDVS